MNWLSYALGHFQLRVLDVGIHYTGDGKSLEVCDLHVIGAAMTRRTGALLVPNVMKKSWHQRDGSSMKFYSKSNVQRARVGPFSSLHTDLISDDARISAWASGRIKGTIGKLETLIVTTEEIQIHGPSPWIKSLNGLKVTKKGLDDVMFTAADGEQRLFCCGAALRRRLIEVVEGSVSVFGHPHLQELDDEVAPEAGLSRVKSRVQTEIERAKDAVETANSEILKARELAALKNYAEFSSVEEMRHAFTPDPVVHGRELLKDRLGISEIYIYEKGFIQFGRVGLAPMERLLAISSSADVNRKTGVGRGVAAVLTTGFSLVAASSNRGIATLTIATDRDTYTHSVTNPENSVIARFQKIAAVGQGVIDMQKSRRGAESSGGSVAEEIAKLAALRASGVLTEEEFQAAKAKLLS